MIPVETRLSQMALAEMQAHWERSATAVPVPLEPEIKARLRKRPWLAPGFRLLRRQFAGSGVPGLRAIVWLARQARKVVSPHG
jgi:hypothetical protein